MMRILDRCGALTGAAYVLLVLGLMNSCRAMSPFGLPAAMRSRISRSRAAGLRPVHDPPPRSHASGTYKGKQP
jgi:hypothetical protein